MIVFLSQCLPEFISSRVSADKCIKHLIGMSDQNSETEIQKIDQK